MYKTLGGIAAAAMLVMVAAPGAAAAQRQETGIHKQAVGEEFSSQKRCVSRRASVRRPAARYSYSYGYPYLAGYGSSPYPAAWESTRGYRYSARDNQASFSWGGPYYAGYGSPHIRLPGRAPGAIGIQHGIIRRPFPGAARTTPATAPLHTRHPSKHARGDRVANRRRGFASLKSGPFTLAHPHRHGRACPGHPRLCGTMKQDVDARHKAGHDEDG